MILFELTGTEHNAVYQALAIANQNRQYDFLRSIVAASLGAGRPFLSQHVIKALNFHAITCLDTNAGEYRPWLVEVGDYKPPQHFRVQALMDDFVNWVNLYWNSSDPIVLASFVLWKLNHIHPFINGNGRTARASCYFVICVKLGGWLKGDPTLPDLLVRDRSEYVAALKLVDQSHSRGALDLGPLQTLISRLLNEQVGMPVANEEVVEASNEEESDTLFGGT